MPRKTPAPVTLLVDPTAPLVRLAPDVQVPARFDARFDIHQVGTAFLQIEAVDGRTRIVEAGVRELKDAGVTGVTFAGIPAQDLLERAVRDVAFMVSRADSHTSSAAAGRSARRRRITDDRLAKVADGWRANGIDGVCDVAHVGVRQAWKLKRDAVDQGFLEPNERAGKKGGKP